MTNAAKAVFPEAQRLLCYPHIALTALPRNRDKLKNQLLFTTAQNQITNIMQMARTFKQFELLSTTIISHWREQKEINLAEWFEREYLTDPHNKFCYSASGIHGITPNNNLLEV